MKLCTIDACDNKLLARGMCNKHYRRMRAHGSPDALLYRESGAPDTPESIWERLTRRSFRAGECLLWQGAAGSSGYGVIRVDGRLVGTHRASYKALVGPIPEGMEIHHTCHTRNCIEPLHLEIVTVTQNRQARKGANAGSTSGVRGVYWNTRRRKWGAVAKADGRLHYAGHFDSLEDAERAAKALRKRLGFYGE